MAPRDVRAAGEQSRDRVAATEYVHLHRCESLGRRAQEWIMAGGEDQTGRFLGWGERRESRRKVGAFLNKHWLQAPP